MALLFKAGSYSLMWIDHTLFSHLSISGHWGHFHLLALVKNVAMNVGVQMGLFKIFLEMIFSCFGCSGSSLRHSDFSGDRAWA